MQMPYSRRVEGFSLSHAQVMDGSTTFTAAHLATTVGEGLDIYGVNDSSITPNADKFDNEGDDAVLSTWNWVTNADLAIKAGYLSFKLIETITRQATGSSTIAGKQVWFQDLWHEDSMNVAARPCLLRMPSRDDNGQVGNLVLGLYRLDFKPITFDGPRYRDGLKVNYDATANQSNVDELGNPFPDGKKRFGKILVFEQ
jgi:hypothetical protein